MTEKKRKRDKIFTIEELYQNKNFVPPKEKNLETIFEEPRKSKDGEPILTSARKYKRCLNFDPTENKINKRKLRAKKCRSKIKLGKQRTRSSVKKVACEDISLYISQFIGDSSDSDKEISEMKKDSVPVKEVRSSDEVSHTSMSQNKQISSRKIKVPKKKSIKEETAVKVCELTDTYDSVKNVTPKGNFVKQKTDSDECELPLISEYTDSKTEADPDDVQLKLPEKPPSESSEGSPSRSSCVIN